MMRRVQLSILSLVALAVSLVLIWGALGSPVKALPKDAAVALHAALRCEEIVGAEWHP